MGSEYRRSNATVRKPREMQSVDKVLASALRRFGLENELARYRFVLHWREIVGAQVAARTRPESIRGDTLVVRVKDSNWAQELTFQKEVILSKLHRFLDAGDVVSDIHFYVGDLSRES